MSDSLVAGRILHAAPIGDTIYLLVSVSGTSSAAVEACSTLHRESVLAWIRIPRVGNHPSPRTVRYESCWELTKGEGLRDVQDSVWVDLLAERRSRFAHVTYERAHPERGIRLRETPVGRPPAGEDSGTMIYRDPVDLEPVPQAIRDTLTQRNCRIPERLDQPNSNAARGAFFGGDDQGWAVWCAIGDSSHILVFRDGSPAPVAILKTRVARLPPPSMRTYLTPCSGGIGGIKGSAFEDVVRKGALAFLDAAMTAEERNASVRDGIIDADCEGGSVILFWTGKRWVALQGSH